MDLLFKIRQLANQRKITISELERRINLSNGQIGKWSKQTPGIDKVQKVADYFGVSVDYLLGREDTYTPQAMYRLNTENLDETQVKELMTEMQRLEEMVLAKIMLNNRKKGE
ncbi:helix-turn-helix transcriptional regulator [Gemella sp. 19428wG2_WT2a]|nr:helix-turn-helix transcriptional regulator [Gemella sp. 19428wG2_WT2a]TFU60319.1 XRE family transcriptional regulator [Gemella sp. WT2a]